MTICPCCGVKSTANFAEGCAACGARPVGEALPRPEIELPSYGRSLLLAVSGTLIMLMFAVETFVSLAERSGRGAKSNLALLTMIPLNFWAWLSAAETAAWRLKWAAIPVTIFVFWFSRKVYHSITKAPDRFCGVRYARRGYLASALFPFLILFFIGITVPERLAQRRLAKEAGLKAQAYRIDRAFDEYREKFGGLPDNLADLTRLPDSDGSLAMALHNLDASSYRPSAELAAVPKQKPATLRGAAIRNASISSADDPISEPLSFTNYELPLPGPDKQLGTEDDLLLRDGVIYNASEAPRRVGSTSPANKMGKR